MVVFFYSIKSIGIILCYLYKKYGTIGIDLHISKGESLDEYTAEKRRH